MGGQIDVKNVLDQGSIFWFTVKPQYFYQASLQSTHTQKPINQLQEMMIKTGRIFVAEDNLVNQKVIKNQDCV